MNVTIVIVTYNGMNWLKKCLDSCANFKTIVVDNNSTDGSLTFIKSNYKQVEVLAQTKNLGFGQANNLGISLAIKQGADFVFLLNQDAYLFENTISDLVNIAIENPDYGVLSPIHINGNETKLDKNFSEYVSYKYNPNFYFDAIKNKLKTIYEVPFVNAAAWLISKKTLQTVGGFDPIFFHYGEDNNYCQRIQFHNLKIGVVPSCFTIHDRAERSNTNPSLFSDKYFLEKSKYFKVKFADPNVENNTVDYELNKVTTLQNKALLKLNFTAYKGFKQLKSILKQCFKDAQLSKTKNIVADSHYLDF